MDKFGIISKVAADSEVRRIAKRITNGNEIYKDILQYLYETLLIMADEKVTKAYNEGYLNFLCIRIMNLAFHQKGHPFNKEHRHLELIGELPDTLTDEHTDNELREQIENDNQEKQSAVTMYLNSEVTQDNFFDVTIFRMWYNGYSYREISSKIAIPTMSVHNSIKRSKETIGKIYG